MVRILRSAALAMTMMFVTTAQAVEFGGVQFPDTLKVKGSPVELRLNGVGYRTKFFFKIYIGALYLPEKSSSPQVIMEQPGPKRIRMHFLYEEVEREKLVNGWNEGFENNNDEATLAKLKDRIMQFNNVFPTLREGDEVLLDYIPRKGTRVTIKGNEVAMIEGKDFYQALLNIWLGDEPADDDLKEALLGLE